VDVAKLIGLLSIAIVAVGVFFGFYCLGSSPEKALQIVTVTAVGVLGLLAFSPPCAMVRGHLPRASTTRG
jgi:hypothetical protein